MSDNLPTWKQCEAAVESGRATPLEKLLYHHEPASPADKAFRRQVRALVESLSTAPVMMPNSPTPAVLDAMVDALAVHITDPRPVMSNIYHAIYRELQS